MINLSKKLIVHKDLQNRLILLFNEKKLPNSIIFSGNRGLGKNTLAFSFITQIFNAVDIKNNNHENLIYNNSHTNFRYITKDFDEKTNKFKKYISIDQIRNLDNFIHQSSLSKLPKFILIDSADDLNSNSANGLLKSLEEPSSNTYFILITHQISNILPTIRSRCVKFYLNSPNIKEFEEIVHLNNKNIVDSNFLFQLTNGSPGLALIFDNEKFIYLNENILKILSFKTSISQDLIEFANNVSKFSNDEFKNFLTLLRFILMTIVKKKFRHFQ